MKEMRKSGGVKRQKGIQQSDERADECEANKGTSSRRERKKSPRGMKKKMETAGDNGRNSQANGPEVPPCSRKES